MQDNHNEYASNDHNNDPQKFPDNGYIPLNDNDPLEELQQKRVRDRKNNIILLVIAALLLMGVSDFFDNVSLFRTEKEIKLSKDISFLNSGELSLEGRNGAITIEGYEGQKIKMNVVYQTSMLSWGKTVDLEIKEDNGKIYLDYDKNKMRGISIKAQIPKGAFNSIFIKTSNGKLEMSELDSETVQLETSNGKVDVEEWRGESLHIKTSNGPVELDEVLGDEIEVKTTNAKVDLDHIKGNEVVIETSNGSIDFESAQLDSKNEYTWKFDTSNASVKLELPNEKEIGYKVDANTSNSSITHQFDNFTAKENTEKVLNGETGNYKTANIKVDIEIHTSNGSIKIE
ncbi:MAG: DUF4097 domain-containing protein [Epulopiscium sp.]|nr:DUF4097 domain-containing protein [Candidatus Epulonipiscium sp.]